MMKFATALFTLLCIQGIAQSKDSTVVDPANEVLDVTLTGKEWNTLYIIAGKRPAEEVEFLRPVLKSKVSNSDEEASQELPRRTVEYLATITADYPWKEVYLVMNKLVAVLTTKDE